MEEAIGWPLNHLTRCKRCPALECMLSCVTKYKGQVRASPALAFMCTGSRHEVNGELALSAFKEETGDGEQPIEAKLCSFVTKQMMR